MREIVWTVAALRDVQGIRAYIGQFNPTAARRVADDRQRIMGVWDEFFT